jgi:hypothetical protein
MCRLGFHEAYSVLFYCVLKIVQFAIDVHSVLAFALCDLFFGRPIYGRPGARQVACFAPFAVSRIGNTSYLLRAILFTSSHLYSAPQDIGFKVGYSGGEFGYSLPDRGGACKILDMNCREFTF